MTSAECTEGGERRVEWRVERRVAGGLGGGVRRGGEGRWGWVRRGEAR